MPKANKQIIIDAIVKEVEKGKAYSKVLAVNVRKWQLSERTFNRYWKIANEQHKEAQQSIKEAKAALDIQNALEDRKGEIANATERKVILTKIARGQIPLRKHVVVDKFIEYIDVVPDYMDRKAAIAELNKMEGDYAPTKIAATDTEGNDKRQVIIINGKEIEF